MFNPDLLGDGQAGALIEADPGSSTVTGAGISLAGLTGKMVIICSVGVIPDGAMISCQLGSSTAVDGSYDTYGDAFGVAEGTTAFSVNLESFPALFMQCIATIATHAVPVCVTYFAQKKYP